MEKTEEKVQIPIESVTSDIPAGKTVKCKNCEEELSQRTLDCNFQVCPHCGYHHPLSADQRIALLVDFGTFEEMDTNLRSVDFLNFGNDGSYAKKLVESRAKTGLDEAVVCGTGCIGDHPVCIAVMDFRFMGASMGSAVGEKITRLIETATARRLPLLIVTASGGARMQEGALSLMQMAKTSGALMRHDEAGLPYIALLTNPTTGGVTASFASLGDVILAEPKAMICFAGPRVIKNTTQSELPPGFQTAEFLLTHGFIDRVVPRKRLKQEIVLFLDAFAPKKRSL